jgi:hypothetical protein
MLIGGRRGIGRTKEEAYQTDGLPNRRTARIEDRACDRNPAFEKMRKSQPQFEQAMSG